MTAVVPRSRSLPLQKTDAMLCYVHAVEVIHLLKSERICRAVPLCQCAVTRFWRTVLSVDTVVDVGILQNKETTVGSQITKEKGAVLPGWLLSTAANGGFGRAV